MWIKLIVLIGFLAMALSARAQQAQRVEVAETTETATDTLPDSPMPKVEPNYKDENTPCPGGVGKPCAFLGGRRYYPDLWHMTEHDRTWTAAMKHPQMVGVAALLLGTTALDIEGTDHCLALHECRELNPLMPKTPNRAWQYSLAMGVNVAGIYILGRLKQKGQGNKGFIIFTATSLAHAYFGLQGFHSDLYSASAGPKLTASQDRTIR